MKRNKAWFSQPTRQAPIAILLIIFNVIKSLIRTWWPFLLIFFFRGEYLTPFIGKTLALTVTLLVIIFSIWQYFRFDFYIDLGKLHIQHGILKRVKLDIPFDRIQSISFEQNIIHQIFSVVKLKVDTAGSSGEEFEFSALERSKAEELRSFILNRRQEVGEQILDQSSASTKDELILSLKPMDLVKVGVSQNHLRTAGIVFAFLLGLRDRVSEALGEKYVDQFDSMTEDVVQSGIYYVLVLFMGLLIVSFFGTLIFTVIRYFNLHFWKTNEGYKTEAGLFNRKEQSALDQKIQILRWVSNPLRKYFGIVYLRLYQASSTAGSRRTTMSVPGCPVSRLIKLQDIYFEDASKEEWDRRNIDFHLFYRRLLFVGVIPFLALLGVGIISQQWQWAVAAGLWILLAGPYQYLYCKKWIYQVSPSKILKTSGVIERISKALFMYKVQGVQIRQSPYQRQHGLASLVLHTASGDVKIPYIRDREAMKIKNYILYKIEASQKAWM